VQKPPIMDNMGYSVSIIRMPDRTNNRAENDGDVVI